MRRTGASATPKTDDLGPLGWRKAVWASGQTPELHSHQGRTAAKLMHSSNKRNPIVVPHPEVRSAS